VKQHEDINAHWTNPIATQDALTSLLLRHSILSCFYGMTWNISLLCTCPHSMAV